MRRLLNPKRVTWASDVNLCQVKLFLTEECPSQVGLGAQDHLQAKASWAFHASGFTSDDNLPPGFEGAQVSNLWRTKLAQIPLIKWEHPSRFILEANWQVVAGEESQEQEAQKQREMRVLEAIYPRVSAIPLNPSPAEHFVHNDQHTPLIPITPIEEEDTVDTSQVTAAPNTNLSSLLMESGPTSSQSSASTSPTTTRASSALEPDALAVAQAALTSIMANDQGNLIDRELLIKILSDPQIIEQLVTHQEASNNLPAPPQSMPTMRPPGFSSSKPTTTNGPFNPPPSRVGHIPNVRPPIADALPVSSTVGAPAKDINYYKSLIQQHGGERQDSALQFRSRSNHHIDSVQEQPINSRSRDSKPKSMKPCIYFNTPRGCRHGVKCAFLHDSPSQHRVTNLGDVQSAKRMKMDREITGT